MMIKSVKSIGFILFQNVTNGLAFEIWSTKSCKFVWRLTHYCNSLLPAFLTLMLITHSAMRSLRAKCYSFFLHSILFIFLMDVYFPMSDDVSNRFGNFIKHLTRSTNEVPHWRGCFRFIVLSINALYHRELPVKHVKNMFTLRAFFTVSYSCRWIEFYYQRKWNLNDTLGARCSILRFVRKRLIKL